MLSYGVAKILLPSPLGTFFIALTKREYTLHRAQRLVRIVSAVIKTAEAFFTNDTRLDLKHSVSMRHICVHQKCISI
jgi:hypothetical protein